MNSHIKDLNHLREAHLILCTFKYKVIYSSLLVGLSRRAHICLSFVWKNNKSLLNIGLGGEKKQKNGKYDNCTQTNVCHRAISITELCPPNWNVEFISVYSVIAAYWDYFSSLFICIYVYIHSWRHTGVTRRIFLFRRELNMYFMYN